MVSFNTLDVYLLNRLYPVSANLNSISYQQFGFHFENSTKQYRQFFVVVERFVNIVYYLYSNKSKQN